MSRLLVVEGDGDVSFFRQLIAVHKIPDYEVYEREQAPPPADGSKPKPIATGNDSFDTVLEALKTNKKHPPANVSLYVIVADCDDNPEKAFTNIAKQISSVDGYAVPSGPLRVGKDGGKKRVAVLLLPWIGEQGALETICYEVATASGEGKALTKCVDAYVNCIKANNWPPQKLAKLKLRCLISARCPKDPNTGLRLAWSGGDRPKDLIPLDGGQKCINRIVNFLKQLG